MYLQKQWPIKSPINWIEFMPAMLVVRISLSGACSWKRRKCWVERREVGKKEMLNGGCWRHTGGGWRHRVKHNPEWRQKLHTHQLRLIQVMWTALLSGTIILCVYIYVMAWRKCAILKWMPWLSPFTDSIHRNSSAVCRAFLEEPRSSFRKVLQHWVGTLKFWLNVWASSSKKLCLRESSWTMESFHNTWNSSLCNTKSQMSCRPLTWSCVWRLPCTMPIFEKALQRGASWMPKEMTQPVSQCISRLKIPGGAHRWLLATWLLLGMRQSVRKVWRNLRFKGSVLSWNDKIPSGLLWPELPCTMRKVPCGIASGCWCDASSTSPKVKEQSGLIFLQKTSNNMYNGGIGSRKQNYFWFEAKP